MNSWISQRFFFRISMVYFSLWVSVLEERRYCLSANMDIDGVKFKSLQSNKNAIPSHCGKFRKYFLFWGCQKILTRIHYAILFIDASTMAKVPGSIPTGGIFSYWIWQRELQIFKLVRIQWSLKQTSLNWYENWLIYFQY